MLIDENAFGILVSYFGIEEDEYGDTREGFAARFTSFRELARRVLAENVLGEDVRALDLGHALYVEVAAGDETESPLAWARRARSTLTDGGYETAVLITHGGRWVEDPASSFVSTEYLGKASLVTVSNASEPLRRALHGEAATRPSGEDEVGWGPGIYLDTEAAEALRMTPKNAPTVLEIAGAGFYRAGR